MDLAASDSQGQKILFSSKKQHVLPQAVFLGSGRRGWRFIFSLPLHWRFNLLGHQFYAREQFPLICPTLCRPLVFFSYLPTLLDSENQSFSLECLQFHSRRSLASVLVNFLGSSFYLIYVFWVVLPFLPFYWYSLEVLKCFSSIFTCFQWKCWSGCIVFHTARNRSLLFQILVTSKLPSLHPFYSVLRC